MLFVIPLFHKSYKKKLICLLFESWNIKIIYIDRYKNTKDIVKGIFAPALSVEVPTVGGYVDGPGVGLDCLADGSIIFWLIQPCIIKL